MSIEDAIQRAHRYLDTATLLLEEGALESSVSRA